MFIYKRMYRLFELYKYNRIRYNVYNKWVRVICINIDREYNFRGKKISDRIIRIVLYLYGV